MPRNIASEGAVVMLLNKSGTTISPTINGSISIPVKAWIPQNASHARGLLYFIPSPKVPRKKLAEIINTNAKIMRSGISF
jgi:hypothetical protein